MIDLQIAVHAFDILEMQLCNMGSAMQFAIDAALPVDRMNQGFNLLGADHSQRIESVARIDFQALLKQDTVAEIGDDVVVVAGSVDGDGIKIVQSHRLHQ